MRRVALDLTAALVNLLLGVGVWQLSLSVFDARVTHYSPAGVLPQWSALPYIGGGYFVLGMACAAWSRRAWVAFIPGVLSFFLALGDTKFGTEYYPNVLWDHLGRPSSEDTMLAAICGALTLMGWLGVRVVKERRTTSSRSGPPNDELQRTRAGASDGASPLNAVLDGRLQAPVDW